MERLLADATKMSGVDYNIDNLADVYEAVHVIQEEIGITGTTAKEAEETLAGSLSAMKSSFKNLLGGIALGEDIGPMLKNLSTTLITFLNNLMPMVTNTIMQIPQIIVSVLAEAGPSLIESGMQAIAGLLTGIGQALPELIPTAIDAVLTLVSTFIENIPLLVQGGIDLIIGLAEGLINAIPIIIEKVPVIIDSILTGIIELLPEIIEAGVGLFTALVEELPTIINNIVAVLPDIIDGIINTIGTLIPLIIDAGIKLLVALVENLPAIIDGIIVAIPIIIDSLLDALVNNIPLIVTAGVQLLTALITNLPKIISEIVKAMPKIIVEMVKALGKGVVAFAKIGLELIKGLWQGIKDAGAWLMDKIKGFVSSVTDGIKKFFGIHSPSKLMADEVGKFLPEGLAIGIEANTKPVTKAMEELGGLTVDSPRIPALSMGGFNYGSANGTTSDTPQTINVYSVLDGKVISKSTSRIQAQTNFGKYRALGVMA